MATPACFATSLIETMFSSFFFTEKIDYTPYSLKLDVVYEDEKLSLIRTYRLDEDINLDILYKACSMLHDSIFLVRSSLHRYDENQMGLVLEVQSMVKTPAELDRYFGTYLQFLYHGIARHREYYCKLLEEAAAQTKETNLTRDNDTKILS